MSAPQKVFLRRLASTAILLFGCSAFGVAAPACLVKPGPDATAGINYRNDCGHPITIVKVARSGGSEQCFRAEMLEGKTWLLGAKDKGCSVLVSPDAPGSKCDCPTGTTIDLAEAPRSTGLRTMSARELAEEREVGLKECKANVFESTYVDCECLVDKTEKDRVAAPEKVWSYFAEKNVERCPNDKKTIVDSLFSVCESTNVVSHKNTKEEFCRCASGRAADAYIAQPKLDLNYIGRLKTNAMLSCGVGAPPAAAH